jgi:hypothetical protein
VSAIGSRRRPNVVVVRGGVRFRVPRVFRGYLGCKERVSDVVIPLIPRGATFVEPFCGGASLSWLAKRYGHPTLSGDMSYYAYLHAAGGVCLDAPRPPDWWVRLREGTSPKTGTLCSMAFGTLDRKRPHFTRRAAEWIDGYCIAHSTDHAALLGLGCWLDTLRPGGRFCMWTNREVDLPEVQAELPKWLASVNEAAYPGRSEARHGRAHELVASRASFAGAVLFLDPAWPFKGEGGKKGQDAGSFYSHPAQVGWVLAQRRYEFSFMSEREHTPYVFGIVEEFLRRGGARAIVATQSTNDPPGEVVHELMRQRWGKVSHQQVAVKGGTHRTGFREYLTWVDG